MFSEFIIGYLFLGGTGGALLVALSCSEITSLLHSSGHFIIVPKHKGRTSQLFKNSRELIDQHQYCWLFCFGSIALGIAALSLDLGRFDRLFQLVLSPAQSALTLGAFSLFLGLAISGILCVFSWIDTYQLPSLFRMIFCVFGLIFGTIIILYTGILLMQSPSVLAWSTWFIPVLFVISSSSCAMVLMAFGVLLSTSRESLWPTVQLYIRRDTWCILVEIIVLGAYICWLFYEGLINEQIIGENILLASWFIVGFVGCGLIAPFILELLISRRNYPELILLIVGFVLLGGFLLRWCIVGLADIDVATELYRTTSTLINS